MAHDTQDDGFHEIQLNGKQLVFLFMAATVVSVVIFLCGVLVGRGVRTERAASVADEAARTGIVADATPQPAASAPPVGSDPTAAAPPPTADDLSYFDRLEKKSQPADELKAAPAKAAAPPVERPARAVAAPPEPKPVPPGSPANSEPLAAAPASAPAPGPGYAIQVAALREHNEADVIAKRLASKGYDAYVITPPTGTPVVYRVRVGNFKTRHEAETVASKLQREEQFKPWITK